MSNLKEFIKLVQENPELPVVCMVASDVVGDYMCGVRWRGDISDVRIDYYWQEDGRAYLKEVDLEGIEEDMENGYGWYFTEKELLEKSAKQRAEELPWIKAIILDIDL